MNLLPSRKRKPKPQPRKPHLVYYPRLHDPGEWPEPDLAAPTGDNAEWHQLLNKLGIER